MVPSAVKVTVTLNLSPCESKTGVTMVRLVPAVSVDGRLAEILTRLVALAGVARAILLWK
ncbi:MAG: hypothetical protein WDO24_02035 [Pseudomonadota bacterium]